MEPQFSRDYLKDAEQQTDLGKTCDNNLSIPGTSVTLKHSLELAHSPQPQFYLVIYAIHFYQLSGHNMTVFL